MERWLKNDTIIFVGEDNLHNEKFQDGTVKCIEDEIPFEVPEGWAWCRLPAITIDIFAGGDKPDNYEKNPTQICNIPIYSNGIENNGLYGYTNKPRVVEPSITISARGTIGFCCIRETPFVPIVRLITITPSKIINLYYLKTVFEALIETGEGSSIPQLTVPGIKPKLIPVPPVNEQARIQNKLHEILNSIANISYEKEELQQLLQTIKSKILDLAIRGKLVPQDPNDEPASMLLERIRAEKEELIKQGKIKRNKKESIIFRGDDNSYYEKVGKEITCIDNEIPFELPDKWSWCRLGNICASIQYGLSNSAESDGTHKLLRITDIQNNMVDWDKVPYTTAQNAENYLLNTDDIVFARTGATVGKSFLITTLPYDSVYASYLIRIRLMDGISPSYIYDFFNSPCYWEQITNKAIGIGQPNCNGTTLSNLLIPVPTTFMQCKTTEIVRQTLKHILTIEQSLS